mgnify:CR=1 FL=1
MYKRFSIRLIFSLAEELEIIARENGLSINSIISKIVWDFVETWKTKYRQ